MPQPKLETAYKNIEIHLNRFGRTRLVKPVYAALAENGEDLEWARQMFANARGLYHPITIANEASLNGLERPAEGTGKSLTTSRLA